MIKCHSKTAESFKDYLIFDVNFPPTMIIILKAKLKNMNAMNITETLLKDEITLNFRD